MRYGRADIASCYKHLPTNQLPPKHYNINYQSISNPLFLTLYAYSLKNIIRFIKDDLGHRLGFIDESLQYQDYKPFFTDMWDAVILSGKQSLLPFELFQSIQRSYSWMKYYNSEIESNKRGNLDEKVLKELLDDVKKSIEKTIIKINDYKYN